MNNLILRILSSLVLAPLVLLAVYYGGCVYIALIIASFALAFYEWVRLIFPKGKKGIGLGRALWLVSYGLCLALSAFALIYLRAVPDSGRALVFYVLAAVWGTDTGAYIAGKSIGGPKLAPKISPNKTWAGLLGGMALAAVFGYGVARITGATHPCIALGFAAFMAITAQAGDLFKSVFKRRAGVKESGRLIPGHGGMLDRIDGLVFAAIALGLFHIANPDWW